MLKFYLSLVLLLIFGCGGSDKMENRSSGSIELLDYILEEESTLLPQIDSFAKKTALGKTGSLVTPVNGKFPEKPLMSEVQPSGNNQDEIKTASGTVEKPSSSVDSGFIKIEKEGKIADIQFIGKPEDGNYIESRFSVISPDDLDPSKQEYELIVYNTTDSPFDFSILSVDDLTPPTQATSLRKSKEVSNENLLRVLEEEYNNTDRISEELIREGKFGKPNALQTQQILKIGTEMEFRIRDDINNPDSFTTTSAVLQALGRHFAFWIDRDVAINVPNPQNYEEDLDENGIPKADVSVPYSGGFSRTMLRNIGKIFDNNIYPLETGLFGSEPNIDGDQRISVLISPIINNMYKERSEKMVEAFVDARDLGKYSKDNPTSNEQELIYMYAPDPCGWYNQNRTRDVISYIQTVMSAQLAKGFEKLISLNNHLLKNGVAEEAWIDEGLGLLAADLAGFGGIFYRDLKMFFTNNTFTLSASLKNGRSAWADSLDSQKYLFMRYLADRFGTPIFKDFFGSKTGVANIEAAIASIMPGLTFNELFRDWTIALSMKSNVVNQEDKDRFQFDDIKASTRYGSTGFQTGIKMHGLNGSMDGDGVYDAFEDRNGNGTYEPYGADAIPGTIDDELNSRMADTDGDGFDDGLEIDGEISEICGPDSSKNFMDFSKAQDSTKKPVNSSLLYVLGQANAGKQPYYGSRAFSSFMDRDQDGLPDFSEAVFYIYNPECCTRIMVNEGKCPATWNLCGNELTTLKLVNNGGNDFPHSPKLLAESMRNGNADFITLSTSNLLDLSKYPAYNFKDIEDFNNNKLVDYTFDLNGNGKIEPLEMMYITVLSEDTNRNNLLDPGEDRNGNNQLDFGIDMNRDGVLQANELLNTSLDTPPLHKFIREQDCLKDFVRYGYSADYRNGDLNGNGKKNDLIFDINGNGICDIGEDKNGDGVIDFAGLDKDYNTLYDNETNMTRKDSDSDGFVDGVEYRLSSDPNNNATKSIRWTLKDTDNDGIFDFQEDSNYNNTYDKDLGETSANKADSDGDGFDDNSEISGGSDPNDSASKPAYVGDISLRMIGSAVMNGVHEAVYAPGNDFAGYVVPFSAMHIRMSRFTEKETNLIIKSQPGVRAVLVRLKNLTDSNDAKNDNPQHVFLESQYGSNIQSAGNDRTSKGRFEQLTDSTHTMIAKIDEDGFVDVAPTEIKNRFENRLLDQPIKNIDKYIVDVPPMTRLGIWIDRRISDTDGRANWNPLLAISRYEDIPQVGVPANTSTGISLPPFSPLNSPFIEVPDLFNPDAQFPRLLSKYDYDWRMLDTNIVEPGKDFIPDITANDNTPFDPETTAGSDTKVVAVKKSPDADFDGISNEDELLKFANYPCATGLKVNSFKVDSDDDGFSDGEEINGVEIWALKNSSNVLSLVQLTPSQTASNPCDPGLTPKTQAFRVDNGSLSPLTPSKPDNDKDFLTDELEDKNGDGARNGAGQDGILGTLDDETCVPGMASGCANLPAYDINIGAKPSDTDGDGYSDGFEVFYGSSPTLSSSKPADIDKDGLPNCLESIFFPRDFDFCPAQVYVGNGWTHNDRIIGTDDDLKYIFSKVDGYSSVLDPDTDGDGLKDGDEYFGLLNFNELYPDAAPIYVKTDPRDPDTDRDGFSDGEEYKYGSDPVSMPFNNTMLRIDLRTYDNTPLVLPGIPNKINTNLLDGGADLIRKIMVEQVRDCLADPVIPVDPESCASYTRYDVDMNSYSSGYDSGRYYIDVSNGIGGRSVNDSEPNALLIKDFLMGGRFLLIVGSQSAPLGSYNLNLVKLPHHSFLYSNDVWGIVVK